MDFVKVLSELRDELANINAAILSLERLQRGGRRRGRPPVWLVQQEKAKGAGRKIPGEARPPASGRKAE